MAATKWKNIILCLLFLFVCFSFFWGGGGGGGGVVLFVLIYINDLNVKSARKNENLRLN